MKHMKKFIFTTLACLMMVGTTLAPVSTVNAAVKAMPACPQCSLSGPVIANAAIYCGKCGKFKGTRYHCQKCYYYFDVVNPHTC